MLFSLVLLEEHFILRVVDSLDDMEREGEGTEHILPHEAIVLFHVVEKRLFVADRKVGRQMVVHHQAAGILNAFHFFTRQQPSTLLVSLLVDSDFGSSIFSVVIDPVEAVN